MKINRFLIFAILATLNVSVASCGEKCGGDDNGNGEGSVKGNTMVIYEANPKLFATSGCLNAVSARLDEIRDLGVNVLWLMPVHPTGVEKGIGSPYCVKDFKAVNSDYGSLADLKSLVNKAHSMGMKVILDWIANHTAWDNAWITAHPEWYTQVNGNIISPAGQNWSDVADLNFDNAGLRAAMTEAMTYWVRETGIDGFRCDYAEGVPQDFWEDAIAAIRALKPDALMLAEASDTRLYEAGFDMLYGWSFAFQLPDVFGGTKTVAQLYETHRKEFTGLKEGKTRMRHIINHDRASENSVTGYYKSEAGSLAATAIATYMGGVPMVYSSQEIACPDKINFFNFKVLDWDSKPAYTTALQKIMSVYAETAGLRGSEMKLYQTGNVVYIHYTSGLSIVVNTKDSEQTIKTPMERVGDKTVDLISGNSYTLQGSTTLSAYEYRILKKI